MRTSRGTGAGAEPVESERAPHGDAVTRPAPSPGSRRGRGALAVGIVLVGVALPLRGLLRYQGPPMEEGFMLVFPQRVLAGDVPNRDFLHLYGPGSLWVLAAAFKLFGTTLATERLVGLAQHLSIIFGVFALARPWGRRMAVACALIATVIILGPVGLTALAWNGGVGLALCGLAVGLSARRTADPRRAARRLVVAGILGGGALLYRPDLIVAVALGYGAMGWALSRRSLVRLVGAGVATASLLIVHVAMAGLRPAFEGMFLEPVFILRGGRSLPLPPSPREFDGFLQKAAGLRESSWPLPMPDRPLQVFLWFFLVPLSAVGVAAVGVWSVRARPASWRSRVLLSAGLFGVGMLPQATQRPDTAHFAWVSCVTLALVPVALVEAMGLAVPRLSPSRAGKLAAGAVAVVLIAVLPFQTVRLYGDLVGQTFGHNVFGASMHRDGRNFYYGSRPAAQAAQRLIDRLDAEAQPGQRLFVGPVDLRKTPYSDAFLYYLFPELEPATRYIEMDPGIANAVDSGLDREVASADWLILSDVWSNWDEPNDSRVVGPDAPNQVVRRHFCLVERDDEFFELWRRCR